MVKASANRQRRAFRISRPHHAGKLHHGKHREQDMQRETLDQPADRELRHRAAQEHRRGQAADFNQ